MQSSLVARKKSQESDGLSIGSFTDPNLETHESKVQHVNTGSAFKLGNLRFAVHPQLGVFAHSRLTATEHPSGELGAQFLQRFQLQDQPERELLPGYAPDMPVYKEYAAKTRNSTHLDAKDPVIQFSLFYDMLLSKITIQLHHISNLPKVSGKGRHAQCDPFVTLHLEPDRGDTLQSEIVTNSCNPVFNQTFQFGGMMLDYVKHQTLVFQIYNHALNDKVIGRAYLPLMDAELFGVIMQMKITEETGRIFQGDLYISLSYSPPSNTLAGMIHKATGLRKQDLLGKADPYIKVVVTYKNKSIYEWKSTVKHKTLAPVYNESFNFEIDDHEIRVAMGTGTVAISCYIVDYDKFSQDDTMGVVNIGKDVPSQLGRRHWNEMLESPCQRISIWHPIQPVS